VLGDAHLKMNTEITHQQPQRSVILIQKCYCMAVVLNLGSTEPVQGLDEGHLKHESIFTFCYIGQKWV